jgi:hypothetical protein
MAISSDLPIFYEKAAKNLFFALTIFKSTDQSVFKISTRHTI